MSDNTINESSNGEIVVSSYGPDGNLSSVSEMQYCIHDIETGNLVRDWTEVDNPSSAQTIELDQADTAIINARNKNERKRMTVKVTYATSKIHYSEYVYVVRAMEAVE